MEQMGLFFYLLLLIFSAYQCSSRVKLTSSIIFGSPITYIHCNMLFLHFLVAILSNRESPIQCFIQIALNFYFVSKLFRQSSHLINVLYKLHKISILCLNSSGSLQRELNNCNLIRLQLYNSKILY